MNEQLIHHYPPELMTILVDAIPRLLKSKKDVLVFFKGCGVAHSVYVDIEQMINQDRSSITKFEIVRQILTLLNDKGDATLTQRREILKRVTQWDDFTACYDNDRMQAKGYVAEIQKLVNVKDSFTRMSQERDKERNERIAKHETEIAKRQRIKIERDQIKSDLFALFSETKASKRGTLLEGVLNRLFKSHGILIRESFRLVGTAGEGVIEQIDGVVEFDGHIYLVEMKWWSQPLGVAEVSQHLVRVFNRNAARGILISQSGYTDPAITTCRESLMKSVFVLAKLEEIIFLLERDGSLVDLLKEKVRAAITDKNPLVEPLRVG
jgi:hypothetical protein